MRLIETFRVTQSGDKKLVDRDKPGEMLWFESDDGRTHAIESQSREISEAYHWLSEMNLLESLIDINPDVRFVSGISSTRRQLHQLPDFGKWIATWTFRNAEAATAFKLRFGGTA